MNSKPMPEFSAILGADKTVHEPARLAILALLSVIDCADFKYIQNSLDLTQGNLSAHISKLEDAGFIFVEKSFVGKRVNTSLSITKNGLEALQNHSKLISNFLKLL